MMTSDPDGAAEILLVGGDPARLEALGRKLGEVGPVTSVHSGAEALEAMERRAFAVVMMDEALPDADGIAAARQVLNLGKGGAPIVLLAEDLNGPRADEAYAAGVVDYLPRSTPPEILRAKAAALARAASRGSHRFGAEEQSAQILESITDAFFALDRNWRFTYLNQQAETLLAHPRDYLLGKNIWEEFAPAVDTEFHHSYHRAMNERTTVTFEACYAPHRRWYEVHAYPTPGGISVYFRDINRRKRAEALLRGQKLVLEGMVRGEPLPALLAAICEVMEEQGHGLHASVLLLDGHTLRHGAAPNLPEAYSRALDGLVIGPEVGSCGTAAFLKETVVVSDIETDSLWAEFRELALGFGLRACWSSPILSEHEEVLGTFAVYHREPHVPGHEERSVAEVLARTAAVAIERHRAEHRLARAAEDAARQERLLEAIVSSTPDLVYVFGRDHRFRYANQALLTMWGRTWEEAIGKNCLELGYEPWHAEMHDREIEQVIATKQPVRGEVPFHGTYGRRIYDYIFVPVLDAQGEVEMVAGTTRDVTERKEYEEELSHLYQLLREQDARKDEFLATLAHELRNPLAPIRTGLHLLRMAPPAETAERTAAMMARQLAHLVRLVDDLLDLSRVSRGMITLQKERVPIRTVVESALDTSRPLLEAAEHRVSVELPAEPLLVDADLTRIAQVVSNLLNNAAKYTPNGGRIDLSASREGDSVRILVRDNGIGIPPEMLPRVWEMFSQAGRSAGREQGGLGIGLSLVKRLVEMHGGSVAVESGGADRGSAFTVTLPLAVGTETPAPPPECTAPGARCRRILVVDDNVDAAETLAELLSIQGHEVRMAHSGFEALEVTPGYDPEVILLDIGMPGMSGHDVARELRKDSARAGTVLVALTGWGSEADRRKSHEAGFDHHLTKPVEIGDLDRLLAQTPAAVPAIPAS